MKKYSLVFLSACFLLLSFNSHSNTVHISSGKKYGDWGFNNYAFCPEGYVVTGCSIEIVENDDNDTSMVKPMSDMKGCQGGTRPQNTTIVHAICAKTCN